MIIDRRLNVALPGNPRYQPEDLIPIFGYDYLIQTAVEVEIATMETLGELGTIPAHDIALLTPEVKTSLLNITTSEVDCVERAVTHHDIRALVRLMQKILPEQLRRWVHIPLTSYDVLGTAQVLQFKRAYEQVLAPKTRELMKLMVALVRQHADTLQIGRTHGQHAIPITVGFWLATILASIKDCLRHLDDDSNELVGKISGPVGAYNAQVAIGLDKHFEARVLQKLGLAPAHISTQILPPAPIARFLFSCLQLSAALGQLGRDCRHLMRTEIGEIHEEYAVGQVGSSTMAHKRNPINFENLEGTWLKSHAEFGKVLACMLSDHQRDLVGSSIMRDFPVIVVNLVHQLNTLLKQNTDGLPFVSRITVDTDACRRNFRLSADVVMAELMFIVLHMAGYEGDGHKLVNEVLVPKAMSEECPLFIALYTVAQDDVTVMRAYERIPDEMRGLLGSPTQYTGRASERALEIADMAENYVRLAEDDYADID